MNWYIYLSDECKFYVYTSRNTCHWQGSEIALKNCTLIYKSYCFDIIECLGISANSYCQASAKKLWHSLLLNAILFYPDKNIANHHVDYKSISILVT